jgi:hypothetical protein
MFPTIQGVQSSPVGIATFGNNMGGLQGGGLNTGASGGGISTGANIAPVTSNPTFISNASGSSTTGTAANTPAYDPNAALYSTINSQLSQLDPQLQVGLQNIGNSYNLGANRLDQQNAAAQRDYTTGVNQNTQSYTNTRNGIIQNTNATANALQRLLGINGAGNSSAAYEQAPYAAGLQGSQNLNSAQQTYGGNASKLDTNWQDTQRSYGNAMQDLGNQKYQQENALRSSIAQTKANLLAQLSNPDTNQINSLLGQITSLGQQYANPVLRTADVSYAAPSTDQYTVGPQAQISNQAGATNDINPTFLGLLTGQRDQYGNLIQQGA